MKADTGGKPHRGLLGATVRRILESELFRTASVYTAAQILNALIPLFLLPILTRHLSAADYGIATLFATLVALSNIIVGLSLHGAIQRAYFDDALDHASYVGTCLFLLVGCALAATLAAVLLRHPIAAVFGLPPSWLWALIITSTGHCLTLYVLTLWQVRMEAFSYGLLLTGQTFVNLALSIVLVVPLSMGWQGRVLAQVFAAAVFAAIALTAAFRRGWIRLQFRRNYAVDALRFGLPLVPHAAGGAALYLIDRTLVSSLAGLDAAGVYMVAVQVGLGIGLMAEAFNRAYSPWLFRRLVSLDREQANRIVAFTYTYKLAIALAALTFALFAPRVLGFVVGREFASAAHILVWIALAQAFAAMYYTVANYVFFSGRTELLAGVMITAACVNAALGYYLTSRYGAVGAAQASAAAFFVCYAGTWAAAAYVYRMPWLSWYRATGPSPGCRRRVADAAGAKPVPSQ